MRHIDPALLHVFKTIVECGSFAAAQVALNSSQSAVSHQMSGLEAKLGLRLCDRGRAGFRLTAEGKAVYEAILALSDANDAFFKRIDALSGVLLGDLHVGVVDNTASNVDSPLVGALRRFKSRDAPVHVYLDVFPPLEIEQRVIDRRLDLGIGCFPNKSPGLVYKGLFSETHGLYCGKGHPLFDCSPPLTLEELRPYEFVHRGYFPASHQMLPANASVTATVATMEAVALLLLTGRYLGYLPEHYASRWVGTRELHPLHLLSSPHIADFDLVYPRGTTPSVAARAFIADLRAELSASHTLEDGDDLGVLPPSQSLE